MADCIVTGCLCAPDSEIVPEYDSAIFKISSFHEKQRKGEEVYSDPLEVQGLVWRLKVYPVSPHQHIPTVITICVPSSHRMDTRKRWGTTWQCLWSWLKAIELLPSKLTLSI